MKLKNIKILIVSVCLILSAVLTGHFVVSKGVFGATGNEKITRNIMASIDYNALLETFDSYELEQTDKKLTLRADKRVDLSMTDLDNLSDTAEGENTTNVRYEYEYDIENNLLYMTVTFTDMDNKVAVDKMQGVVFQNENGEIDVYFEDDGEIILMSEMVGLTAINDCGWFSKLVKKVVVAVVAVVVVSAVAAVVVATAGAGLGAVVAAGAIAGGITGGVAGGIISYQETGVVEPWAILTGAVGGAAIGALVGWGIGTIMGVNNTTVAVKFGQGSFKTVDESLSHHFTKHGAEVGARNIDDYLMKAKDFAQTIVKNNIKSVRPVVGATPNVMRYEMSGYYIHMAMNAKEIIIVSFGLIF